jgi:hypothetical protein
VTVLRVVDVDDSGRAWAVPERWEGDGPPPRLRVMERKGRGTALGVGDRISLAPKNMKCPAGHRRLAGSPIR